MPKCKNDSKRHYSGKEPSPKGKGYCAHACTIGSRKRGHDKKWWVVRKAGAVKRWVRQPTKKPLSKTKTRPTKRKASTTSKSSKRTKKVLRGGVGFKVDMVNPKDAREFAHKYIKLILPYHEQIAKGYNQPADTKINAIKLVNQQTLQSFSQEKQLQIAKSLSQAQRVMTQAARAHKERPWDDVPDADAIAESAVKANMPPLVG